MESHELKYYWKQVEKVGREEYLSDEIENLTKRVEELKALKRMEYRVGVNTMTKQGEKE